ncbi:hypothetical protein SAY86_021538 [Trapa natans]|uniref:Uncharacterized protein n=1 Tax=Trapa natans TaxID=22666 RepID=A0AAN7MUB1_TRANT|nr:hypothetical protein SAY86_021538 [Trapa natans]
MSFPRPFPRSLDKAADNKNPVESQMGHRRQVTVTKVEEVKLILNMFPIWIVTLPFGICVVQATTFFIKQGTALNRNFLGGFVIPPASIYAMAAVGMIVSVTLYEKILVPVLRQATGNERGIKILQRIGIGMVFSVLTMVVAALVERKRLGLVRSNGSTTSMSVFWLAPQFIILGFCDGFAQVGLQEYFYDQVPDLMRSLGIAFYLSAMGAANFLSSLLITAVDRLTTGQDGRGWFGKDLNSSRLDNYYWLLAIVALVNLCFYIVMARRYSYKNV